VPAANQRSGVEGATARGWSTPASDHRLPTLTTPFSILPRLPRYWRPTWAVQSPSLRSPVSSTMSTPPGCGAVAASVRKISSRRGAHAAASQVDSLRNPGSRCAAGACAPSTGSVRRRGQRLGALRGQEQPSQVLAQPLPLGGAAEQIVDLGGIGVQGNGEGGQRGHRGHLRGHPTPLVLAGQQSTVSLAIDDRSLICRRDRRTLSPQPRPVNGSAPAMTSPLRYSSESKARGACA
jgi:hypothetical protein